MTKGQTGTSIGASTETRSPDDRSVAHAAKSRRREHEGEEDRCDPRAPERCQSFGERRGPRWWAVRRREWRLPLDGFPPRRALRARVEARLRRCRGRKLCDRGAARAGGAAAGASSVEGCSESGRGRSETRGAARALLVPWPAATSSSTSDAWRPVRRSRALRLPRTAVVRGAAPPASCAPASRRERAASRGRRRAEGRQVERADGIIGDRCPGSHSDRSSSS